MGFPSTSRQRTGRGTFANTINAAEATIRGWEVELTALPTPYLTPGGNYSYLHGEYDEFLADLTGDGIITDNTNRPVSATPKYMFSAWARIEVPLGPGYLSLFGQYRFQDTIAALTTSDIRSQFPREYRTQASAAYAFELSGREYRASLFLRDIGDNDEGFGFLTLSSLFSFGAPRAGRTWGLEIQVDL